MRNQLGRTAPRCAWLVAAALIWPGPLMAAEPWQEIISTGWAGDAVAVTATEQHFEALTVAAKSDPRTVYALALVQLKGRQFDAALVSLDKPTLADDLPAARAKLWTLTFSRQHEAALAQMQSLLKRFPSEKMPEDIEAQWIETARWLGRFQAYFEFAAPPKDLKPLENLATLASKLTGERRQAFDDGRTEVQTAVGQLQADLEKVRAQDREDDEKRRQLAADANQLQRQRIAKERGEITSAGKEAKEKADRLVEELDSQLKPLQSEYKDLQNRARPIVDRIGDWKRRADQKDRDARNEKDNNRKRDLQRDADRLRDNARDEQRKLDPIQREMNKLEHNGNRLQAERNRAVGAFQATVAGLNKRLQMLTKDENAIEKSEKQLQEKPGATPRQAALAAKLAALTTYQKFPLEEEYQRLMKPTPK